MVNTSCGRPGDGGSSESPRITEGTATSVSNNASPAIFSQAIDGHTLNLPRGFSIDIWISGFDSLRMMALTNDGYLLVTEMGKGNVLAFNMSDNQPSAVTTVRGLKTPSGIAFHDGHVWVAETTRVTKFPYTGAGQAGVGQAVIAGLPSGGHGTRTIGFGPDGKLYLAVGSSCNICEESDQRRAVINRYNPDGSGGGVFASGLRNTVGFVWQPSTGAIWGVDNGRDNLGDDLPPEEVNIIQQGKNYGWPYCYGNRLVDPFGADHGKSEFCQATEPPVVEMQAHSAPLGLRFLDDPAWPASHQGDLFIAFHGSWNRSMPTGYKVVRLDKNGVLSDFITGWEDANGEIWGRPVDILIGGGVMYVSDDQSGSVYRIRPLPAA